MDMHKPINWIGKIYYKFFYKRYFIRKEVDECIFEVEYHRGMFYTNEKYTIKNFLKKIKQWHGQVWLITSDNGSKVGFRTAFTVKLFPRTYFKNFLDIESDRLLDRVLGESIK